MHVSVTRNTPYQKYVEAQKLGRLEPSSRSVAIIGVRSCSGRRDGGGVDCKQPPIRCFGRSVVGCRPVQTTNDPSAPTSGGQGSLKMKRGTTWRDEERWGEKKPVATGLASSRGSS
jgi:hypothetical protein